MLEVSNLTKRFGDIVAVDDTTLSVKDGEFFSIVGPSGSGKSTMLRCIGGLDTPQTGTILLDDEDVTELAAYERDTSTVFQNLALFPHMTVYENIEYGMKRGGVDEGTRKRRIKEYLELVDLPGYADRKTTQLSGGEQQRVALARSLVVQPKLMLLDEPLASLDQQLRVQLQNELYELQRELNQTSIYVTHDQNVALSISDRVAVMNEGRLEQVGAPYDLYENPETEFVASFIGDSAKFVGTVTAVDDATLTLELTGSGETVHGKRIDNVSVGDAAAGVVKVEDFDIRSPTQYENQIDGELQRISYRGKNTKLMLDVGEDGVIEVFTDEIGDFTAGDDITAGWPWDGCPIFKRADADE